MIVIITSCGSIEEAERIAAALVDERLAACVQIVPATSVYRWAGAVKRAQEHVLHIKTRAGHADAIEERIKALHYYAMPELIVLAVAGGSADYLAWARSETARA